MKKTIVIFSIVLAISCSGTKEPIYRDSDAPIEKRIENLLGMMTLEEKVMQTVQRTYGKNMNENNVEGEMKVVSPMIGSLLYRSPSPVYRNQIQRKAMEESRLGIPIIFGFDVIHGFRTIFPIPLAQSSSWNAELVKESCRIAARESKLSGVDWTFSPMVDVARDSRWGRVSEGYGEDPYVNSVYCVAAIEGYQGDNLSDKYSIAACIKHYVGYSLSEGGRDYNYSDVSDQALWETFMPPYEAGVKAGAATLMSGFNDMNGIPVSANRHTLTEILKERWGHDGFVVSDWASIMNLVPQGVAQDEKEACYKAFMAGVEMDMVDDIYLKYLGELVDEGRIPMKVLDEAVRRILRVKFQLGLFDNPYVEELPENERFMLQTSIDVARQLTEESVVLLKNLNNTLPLDGNKVRIALLGPVAKDSASIMGTWMGQGRLEDVVTIYEGMKSEFGAGAVVKYAKGCDFDGDDMSGFAEALSVVRSSNVVVLCMGEKSNWSGENGSRSSLALPTIQEKFVEQVRKLGKPVVLILSSGRPLELIRLEPLADAIVEIWQPGITGGEVLAGILSGRLNPSGKLAITFPQTTGQQPMHYNRRQSARPKSGYFQDIPKEPMYDFGHGLSYTEYEYGELRIEKTTVKRGEVLVAEIEVSNVGGREGKEAVLWFVSDPVASISRPMKELKYFEKKTISASKKQVYRFEIDPVRDLSFPDAKGERHLEAGEFYVSVKDQRVRFELVD